MANDRPHGICEACHTEQSERWLSETWLYCRHFRVMARRRKVSDAWTVDRGVQPERARAHLEAATSKMAEHAAKQGTTLEAAEALVQRAYEERRAQR